MPNALQTLKDEGWNLTDKGYSQCVEEVGEDVAKLKEYLLDVCLPLIFISVHIKI